MRCRFQPPRFCWILLLCLLLSACGGASGVVSQKTERDRQWLSSMQTGYGAFNQGEYLLARRLFEQALDRGRQMDRADHIADAAFNLAAAQIELGELTAANRSLLEAKNESRRRGDPLGNILLLEAITARLQADPERSQAVTNQLLQQLPESNTRLQIQAQLLSGLLACEAEDMTLAEQMLAKTAELLDNDDHPTIAAARAELQGCIKLLQNHPMEAAAAFDREIVFLQQARHYRQMVVALQKAGTAYTTAGRNQQAADRLFRAARSIFSQNRPGKAELLLEKAEAAARTAEAHLLLENIARLRKEIANRKQHPSNNHQ